MFLRILEKHDEVEKEDKEGTQNSNEKIENGVNFDDAIGNKFLDEKSDIFTTYNDLAKSVSSHDECGIQVKNLWDVANLERIDELSVHSKEKERHVIKNNGSISKYSKFHIRGEVSRNDPHFSKICSLLSYNTLWHRIQRINALLLED
ncbi:unnamed protein product [Dovyalis caffra]|uniref:Uncharacterized protein n=1 Tax=Dovyalis caffra TaxID=77055 RepID=A0AAV1R438_9ROSI|nr:unnamed protein product [Dovyalis caffra]